VYKPVVDFGSGVLVFAHHHRIFALPEHKNIFGKILQQVFFGGEAEIRVGIFKMDTKHFSKIAKCKLQNAFLFN
jgi:hypothetical protein